MSVYSLEAALHEGYKKRPKDTPACVAGAARLSCRRRHTLRSRVRAIRDPLSIHTPLFYAVTPPDPNTPSPYQPSR